MRFIDPYEIQHAIHHGISINDSGALAISAGTLSSTRSDVTFSNSNGVSFGLNTNGVITASVGPAGAGLTNIKVSAGTLSDLRSDITFSNSGGVSFGLNGAGVVTATVATNYQSQGAYLTTAQPPGAYLTTAMQSDAGSAFAGINGSIIGGSFTLNTSGATISLPSYLTTAALSQDSSKYAGTGFTTATTAGTNIVGTLNNSGLSMGVPAYLTTAAAGSGAGTGFTTATTPGTNVVGTLDTNGLSMGIPAYLTTAAAGTGAGTNTSVVTTIGSDLSMALDTNGLTIAYPRWLTAAMGTQVSVATITGTDLVLSGNFSGVTASYPKWLTTAQPPGAYLTTAQPPGAYLTTAMASDASSAFAGTNGSIAGGSFTLNTSGATISLPAYLTTFAYPRLDQVLDPTADKVFSMGSNQLQLSWATGGSFSTNATRQGMFELDVAGNLTQEADVVHLHQHGGAPTLLDLLHIEGDGANVTGARLQMSASIAAEINQPIKFTTRDAGFSIGSVPMIMGTEMSNSVANLNANYLQGRASSQLAGVGFTSASTAGTAVVATLSTNGLSVGVPAYLTTAQSPGAYLTTAQPVGNYAGTATSVVTTGGTDLSFAVNTNGATIAYPKWITTYATAGGGAGTGFTSTSTAGAVITAALGTDGLSMAVPNYLTTYVNDLTSGRAGVNTSVATTAGTDLTLGVNTSGVTIGYPKWLTTAAAAPSTWSYWGNLECVDEPQTGASAIIQTSGSSIFMQPFFLPYHLSVGWLRLLASFNDSAVGTGGTTSANLSYSVQRYTTVGMVVYTQGIGASSRSLQSITSSSAGLTGLTSYGAGVQGSRYTVTVQKSYPVAGTTSQWTTSWAVSSASIVISSNSNTLFTGFRFFDLPLGISLGPGAYWLGIGASTSSASQSSHISFAGTCGMAISLNCVTQTTIAGQLLGAVSSASDYQLQRGLGVWTTNASIWSKDSIGVNSISQVASGQMLPFWMMREA